MLISFKIKAKLSYFRLNCDCISNFMKRYKINKITIIVILFQFTFTINAQQRVYYVGISNSKIQSINSSQQKAHWCWAASIQMVLNYYNIDINQKQIVERTYGTNPNGELPDWSASIGTIHNNLNNLNIDNTGTRYKVKAQYGSGAPEPYFLIEELSQKRPVVIGFQSNFGGHTAVITALSYYETKMGPVIRSIVVRDPMPSNCMRGSNGRMEYEGATLANRIVAHWFVRVFKTPN